MRNRWRPTSPIGMKDKGINVQLEHAEEAIPVMHGDYTAETSTEISHSMTDHAMYLFSIVPVNIRKVVPIGATSGKKPSTSDQHFVDDHVSNHRLMKSWGLHVVSKVKGAPFSEKLVARMAHTTCSTTENVVWRNL